VAYNVRVRVLLALSLAFISVGCFTPNLGDGAVACGDGDICPPRYFCHADRHCYKTPDSQVDMADSFDFAGIDFSACMRASCDTNSCGVIPDQCGSTIDCGMNCAMSQSCGGGGVPHVCGCPTELSCNNKNCGTTPDGCGSVLNCGPACSGGQICGAGNKPNVCGNGSCTPKACSATQCGLVSDGCSAVIDCGGCKNGRTCVSSVCV
jgi:hypothetical protein